MTNKLEAETRDIESIVQVFRGLTTKLREGSYQLRRDQGINVRTTSQYRDVCSALASLQDEALRLYDSNSKKRS